MGFGDPRLNQAEAQQGERASHSAYGLKFRLAMLMPSPATGYPQTAEHPNTGKDWRGSVVRDMVPLYREPGWRDFIGVFMARPAKTIPVIAAVRYQGQLPMGEQPIVEKPWPWEDPTLGEP